MSNPNHYPAGSKRGGEFAPKSGGSGGGSGSHAGIPQRPNGGRDYHALSEKVGYGAGSTKEPTLGKTSSGRKIYSDRKAGDYKRFTAEDHRDAGSKHLQAAEKQKKAASDLREQATRREEFGGKPPRYDSGFRVKLHGQEEDEYNARRAAAAHHLRMATSHFAAARRLDK